MKKLFMSFVYALNGIKYAITYERNFRIHITAVFYVTLISFLCELSTFEHIVIIFCFAGVISMELLNTAFERLCDKDGKEFNEMIKLTKDLSAGAVLVYSLASVIIGGIIYVPKLPEILKYMNMPIAIIIAISIPVSALFIFKGVKK